MIDRLNCRTPVWLIFLVLMVADLLYQINIRHLSLLSGLYFATVEAFFLVIILFVSIRLDLIKVSLCFLLIPYLFFIPGWLNMPTAFTLAVVLAYCFFKTLKTTTSIKQEFITGNDLIGFCLILIWVNLSGAGGYGHQTSDYQIHNARLSDLTEYQWPVRYGENQNLVYYMGYFLPSAIIGKLTNITIAISSMYLWTAFGVMLALRWLSQLSGWCFSALLVLLFIFFGPMDILSVITFSIASSVSFGDTLTHILVDNDFLDFRASKSLGFFIGNYVSNNFQLYWSPQQIISGWIVTGLISYCFREKITGQVIFAYALLCLWAPLVMISLMPFMIVTTIYQLKKQWRDIVTFENTIGAGLLAVVFITFYMAGSGSANSSYWIPNNISTTSQVLALASLFVFGWGIYVLAIAPYIMKLQIADKVWFVTLVLTLLILPFRTFGEWADLLCRGSAPLMFLLLVFILQALRYYWNFRCKTMAVILTVLLIPGTGSALLLNYNAFLLYGGVQPIASIITYDNAYPNLGPDNTVFENLFRKPLPVQNINRGLAE